MVLVQAEERRPLRIEAMKPGKPGDIQTLGKNASTGVQTAYHYYMLGGQKEVLDQTDKVNSWATTCLIREWTNDLFRTNHGQSV